MPSVSYYLWNVALIIFYLVYIPLRNLVNWITAKPVSLKGKVCLVTGSGRGLGREICITLGQKGASIACIGISKESNETTVKILTEMGVKAKAYKMNVANKQEVDAVCQQIEDELGTIYLLINNAAIVIPNWDAGEQYVRAVFNINTLGAMWTTEAVLPKMKERNEGHIVYINSVVAFQGLPLLTAYAPSKAALVNYSQGLRMELNLRKNNNIYVTNVFPTGCDEYNGVQSEDLIKIPSFLRQFLLSTYTEVADCTMRAIEYRKEDVSPKPLLYYSMPIMKYIPAEVILILYKLIGVGEEISLRDIFTKLWQTLATENTLQAGNDISSGQI